MVSYAPCNDYGEFLLYACLCARLGGFGHIKFVNTALTPCRAVSFQGGIMLKLPLLDNLSSIALSTADDRVFISVCYEPSDQMPAFLIAQHINKALHALFAESGLPYAEMSEVQINGEEH